MDEQTLKLIENYKALAYTFAQFVLEEEVDIIAELYKTDDYINLVDAAQELVKRRIKIKMLF